MNCMQELENKILEAKGKPITISYKLARSILRRWKDCESSLEEIGKTVNRQISSLWPDIVEDD